MGIIDHQQDPGPLNNRRGGTRRFHEPRGGLWGLLHGTGKGAKRLDPGEEKEAARGWGCLLSMAGEAGELVELSGRCRSVM